jgi:hypothetical protein
MTIETDGAARENLARDVLLYTDKHGYAPPFS